MSRVLTGLVAVVSALLLAVTVAPTTAQAQAKPDHEVRRLDAGETDNGKFFAKGRAVTYKGKFIKIQRQTNGNGPYNTFDKQRTSKKNGAFRFVFDGPVNSCYRLLIPKTKRNATTKIRLGCIVPQ